MIYYSYEDISQIDLNKELISKWISAVLHMHNAVEKEITYIFCSDEYLLGVNREFLNHDYFTDIITFDYCEQNFISGDILISLDTVRTNAKDYNTTFIEELHRVIIHGILHLLGFKDKTSSEAELMHKKEDEALELLKTI